MFRAAKVKGYWYGNLGSVKLLSDFSSKDDAVRESGGFVAVSMCAAASSAVPQSP